MRSVPLAVTQFVSLVRETTGNVVPRARYGFLEEVLERRARAIGQPDVGSYVRRLVVGELEDEWGQLIPLITIKESYFYRAPQQFRALLQVLLPRLMRKSAATRSLRVWSAACARGEEPATLAMVLAESGLLGGWDWRILATDVDQEALAAAQRGIYGERAVAHVPPSLLERYFKPRGKLYELVPELRARIDYEVLNLARAPYRLSESSFDLIFLRNVLIYFQRPLQRRVVTQVAQFLGPQGYLFLGASETLWQIHEELYPLDLDVCFCYHHPQPGEQPAVQPPRPRPESRPLPPARPPSEPEPYTPALELSLVQPEPLSEAMPTWGDGDLGELDDGGPVDPSREPCAVQEHLAKAAGMLAENRMEEAARLLEEALSTDPSEPAAHALEGFLFDLQAKPVEAVGSYRAALYLEPDLYQVRVLLADCLLRLGATDRARHQFREVLSSLASGRERDLVALEVLPLPSRVRAERRCRQVLRGR